MEKRVTSPRRVTSPTWGLPPPCKQALKYLIRQPRQTVWTFPAKRSGVVCKMKHESGPDYTVSFSPGWDFAPPTGLKYCCDYMLNFSPRPKRKFSMRKFTEIRKHSLCTCSRSFSARAEKMIAITRIFQPVCPFARSGFRNRARIFSPGWNPLHVIATFILRGYLSEGLKFQPGLKSSPCNRYFHFKRISLRRAEVSARDEIRHVISPSDSCLLNGSRQQQNWSRIQQN